MGKYDGFLLMSDFDRTLSHDMTISDENCDAIKYFQSEGGLFSLASGRRPGWSMKWADRVLPNTWCAMINGAVLCDNEGTTVIYRQPLDNGYFDLAETIYEECPKLQNIHFVCYEHSLVIQNGESLEPARHIKEPIYKLLCYTPLECSDAYAARIASIVGEDRISMRSWINGIEIQSAATGKGNAVKRLREILGARIHTVVAAGDYENDIDMLRAADIGYAVANAVPAVKAAADRVTVSCEEHAIARIIEEIG